MKRQPDVYLDSIEIFEKNQGWKMTDKKLQKPRANFGYGLIPHSLIPNCKVE